jgi:hemoglobin-like flavoprotein
MSLTAEQKNIIRTTFAQVKDADLLASRFYARLFHIDPTTQPLFTHDMAEQRQKLIQTLAVVVNSLDKLESLVPAIQSLGKRHVEYGVTVEHWHSVGTALLWALDDAFGAAFTIEVRVAWAAAYGVIMDTAIEAAYPVAI